MIHLKELEDDVFEDELEERYDYLNEEPLDEDTFDDESYEDDDDIHEYCD